MRIVWFLLEKEFHQLRRNRTLLLLLLAPVVQLLVLSNAANYEIRNLNLVVVDQDHSPAARRLVDKFQYTPYFRLVAVRPSVRAAEQDLLRDRADVVLVVPRHFERALVRERRADVQLLVNALNSVKAGLAGSYAASIVQAYQGEARPATVAAVLAGRGGLEVVPAYWYNPRLNYKTFMVPGLIFQIMTLIVMFLATLNIVREKEIGTIEQLNVTPIRKWQFMLGKLLPFWLAGFYQLSVGLLVARLVFQVPLVGSLPLLYAATALYLTVPLGIGLLISASSRTQQQALFVAFFFLIIFVLLSGLFTPIEYMPAWAQALDRLNPLAYIIRIARMVLLKGSTARDIAGPLGALLLLALTVNALAVWRYRKTSG
ncbi:ABC transporter permease [Hymenobacter rubripertinctus]|uniref:ABC transporter permease n=1 Tax=Hymenobacter rubripertinctus TaxID=2029981 RepID=A0A418QQX2_9BACT|nr:ABC transporter permease [Hymenobacter rubripertinctus]RIY07554.1 ABC transporter permease [Hymenobacter rubripertinctus]